MRIANTGLTGFDIAGALTEYGRLFITSFDDGSVIFKPLSFERHKQYLSLQTIASVGLIHAIQQRMFVEAVVWSSYPEEEVEDLPAGIVSSVAKMIMRMSGPMDAEGLLDWVDAARAGIDNIATVATEIIAGEKLPLPGSNDTWEDVVRKINVVEDIKGQTLREKYLEAQRTAKLEEAQRKSITEAPVKT